MGTYNKLKMKKFGLCKIVKRHDFGDIYEVEFLVELNISDFIEYYEEGDGDEVAEVQWSILAASSAIKETKEILENHVGKSTRKKTYKEYLVKWKGILVEDSSWIEKEDVNLLGFPLNT